MKKISIVFVVFLIFNNIYSQVDRTIGRIPQQQQNRPKTEKNDPIDLTLAYLKEKLSLDSFQEAAIKVYLLENQTSAEKIHNSELSNDDKKLKFDEVLIEFDEKVIKILNPQQIKAFYELKDKNNPKEKKKKKKKKEEEN